MLNRVYYVLSTYVTRPAFWVLGGLYVVGVVVVANFGDSRNTTKSVAPGPPRSLHTLFLSDPESIQKFDEGIFDRNVRAVTIFWHNENVEGFQGERILPDGRRELLTYPAFSPRHLRQLRECPHLKTLTLQFRGRLTDDEWRALGDLDQLTAFKYDGEVSAFGMRQIARLNNLRFLDLSGGTFEAGLDGLETLPHLQTFVLDNFVENGVHVLGQFRRLPHLRALVVTHYRTVEPNRTKSVWQSDLGDIQAVPGLQQWFVDDQARGFPGFEVLAGQLPRVEIRPVFVDADRQVKCLLVVLPTGLMIFLFALQLNSQFAHPAARLTPGYAVPHFIAATVVWLCSILVPVCMLAAANIPSLPRVGFSMALWLGCGSLLLCLNPMALRPRNVRSWSLWMLFVPRFVGILFLPALLLGAFFNPSAFDWFLRGQQPGLAITAIAAGILCYFLVILRVRRIQNDYQEAGMGIPPLGFNHAQMTAYYEHVIWRQPGVAESRLPVFDRRLARAIEQSGRPGWRKRSNLWISGNKFSGKQVLLLGLFMLLINVAFDIAFKIWDGRGFEFTGAIADSLTTPLALTFLMLPDFCYLFLGAIWRGRLRLAPLEYLRPASRQTFVRESMTAFAWDCVPTACVYFAVVAAFTYLADPAQWSPVWTIALVLYLAAHVATAYGAISWLITIRRGWVAALVGIGVLYVFVFAAAGSGLMFLPVLGVRQLPPDLPNVSHGLLLTIGLAWSVAAAALIAYAYRRWMRIEFGDWSG